MPTLGIRCRSCTVRPFSSQLQERSSYVISTEVPVSHSPCLLDRLAFYSTEREVATVGGILSFAAAAAPPSGVLRPDQFKARHPTLFEGERPTRIGAGRDPAARWDTRGNVIQSGGLVIQGRTGSMSVCRRS